MTEVGGVPGSHQVQVETDASEAVSTTRPAPAAVDTEVPSAVGMPRASASELPPSNGPIDYGLAISAVGAMSENVGVDFGRIAALMMMIDSELSRAARDSQVEQIEEIATEMHKSADDLRASAKMALVGGCVAGSMQIASAGITIGGGRQGHEPHDGIDRRRREGAVGSPGGNVHGASRGNLGTGDIAPGRA